MRRNSWNLGALSVLSLVAGLPHVQANEQMLQSSPPSIAVWDTERPAVDRLTSADLASRDRWTKIPRNQKLSSFQGDAILSNGRVLAVLRKRGVAVDVYSIEPTATVPRVRLELLAPGDTSMAISPRLIRKAAVSDSPLSV
jgi:hypothetical protein